MFRVRKKLTKCKQMISLSSFIQNSDAKRQKDGTWHVTFRFDGNECVMKRVQGDYKFDACEEVYSHLRWLEEERDKVRRFQDNFLKDIGL